MIIVQISYTDLLGVDRQVIESIADFRSRCEDYEMDADPKTADPADLADKFSGVPEFERENISVELIESEWDRFSHAKFAQEANDAGLDVYRYRGRFGYDGPAVNADNADEVTRHVTGRMNVDIMGLGVVVYPR